MGREDQGVCVCVWTCTHAYSGVHTCQCIIKRHMQVCMYIYKYLRNVDYIGLPSMGSHRVGHD